MYLYTVYTVRLIDGVVVTVLVMQLMAAPRHRNH